MSKYRRSIHKLSQSPEIPRRFACEQYLAILHRLQVNNFESLKSPPSFLDFLQTPQNEPLTKAGPEVESLFPEAAALIFLVCI